MASGQLDEDQEVLVVTLVNSAVDNFTRRVGDFVQTEGLLPNLGYRVRTLHGLAHDIVRARPELVQLGDKFEIIDEREANAVRQEAVRAWLRSNPSALDRYLNAELEESRVEWVRRERIPELVSNIALAFIRSAKDRCLSPSLIRERLDACGFSLPLAAMGVEIFSDYQRALEYRGAVDFDDLIRLALLALQSDPDYLSRLQMSWPYILEDEAQDSSRLQEEILSMLAGARGNWVRVGDPNQAIYETFTTANPQYLIDFLKHPKVNNRQLPNSGRSTQSIIDLANELVIWTRNHHPVLEARSALNSPPLIEPAPAGDPQPNPSDDPKKIFLMDRKFTPLEEIQAIADSLARWLPDHPQATVAVLAPRNQRGFEMADELHRRGLTYEDGLLRSSSLTRFSAGAMAHLLRYLANPHSSQFLSGLYLVWRRDDRKEGKPQPEVVLASGLLRNLERVEDFIWPGYGSDWLVQLENQNVSQQILDSLAAFRQAVRRWQSAVLLPIDQMLISLSHDILAEPNELAVAYKLAALLRQTSRAHPDWRLPELSEELAIIARNERRFLGFSDEDFGFDPDRYPGKVVVATMHKAKGLEWDRVYLMSLSSYDFPADLPGDLFISEPWFLRDRLDLSAEAVAELQALFEPDISNWYQEGLASYNARQDYVRERLRLFYVGITRARKELVVTWNSGREGRSQPALAFVYLQDFWRGSQNQSSPDVGSEYE